MRKNAKEIVARQLDQLMTAIPDLGSQQKLAKKTGIGQTTIGRIRRGEVNATAENLKAIADAFGVAVGYLYGETTENGLPLDLAKKRADELVDQEWNGPERRGQMPRRQSDVEEARNAGRLPLISWVQAGEWSQIVDNFQPGDAEEWIPCPFNHGPNAFILRVVGYSMHNPGGEKSYAPGDYIAVDPRIEPQHKRLVVVKIDDEETATFKQLLIEPDGTHLLQALNPSWPSRIMKMPEGSRIVGVVIGKWTPE